MNNKKKTAIIGCGSISHTHITALNALGISDIAAVCDINAERLEQAAQSCPQAKKYTDYKKMLAETDAEIIHVCTPHYLHAQMAIASLESGRDVYLEKPCAMNREQAEKIVEASDKSGKKVCVSFQNRLVNTTVEAKKIVDGGEMGKLLGAKGIVTWHREGAYYSESGWRGKFATEGGGVLMNQSIHTLDLMYYFLGKAESVFGKAVLNKNFDVTEVEDTAEAFIRFGGGKTGIFYATNCNIVDSPIELELYLEKGSLLIRNDALYKCVGAELSEICKNENILNGKAYWGNGHIRMISAFYSAISGGSDYYCDIRDSIQVLDIIAQIYKNSDIKPDKI